MEKVDLYKAHAAEYAVKTEPRIVTIGPATYLAVPGTGEPGGETFSSRIDLLYNVAFTIKMASKFAGRDYAVSKLEGLWWAAPGRCFLDEPRESWNWKMMIRTPDFITESERQAALEALRKRRKGPGMEDVELVRLDEGTCVQVLHVCPYEEERGTIERMEAFVQGQGLMLHGLHHEIYYSDPRRVAPEKLRTILRHPVR